MHSQTFIWDCSTTNIDQTFESLSWVISSSNLNAQRKHLRNRSCNIHKWISIHGVANEPTPFRVVAEAQKVHRILSIPLLLPTTWTTKTALSSLCCNERLQIIKAIHQTFVHFEKAEWEGFKTERLCALWLLNISEARQIIQNRKKLMLPTSV